MAWMISEEIKRVVNSILEDLPRGLTEEAAHIFDVNFNFFSIFLFVI